MIFFSKHFDFILVSFTVALKLCRTANVKFFFKNTRTCLTSVPDDI